MKQRRVQEIKIFGIAGIVLTIAAAIMEYRTVENVIEWISYDNVFNIAKEEQKAIYVVVYAEWCGPCKLMDKTTFANDTVINSLQNDLVATRVNIDDERTGADVKKKFNIQAMPTSLLLTPDGQEIKRHVGYMSSTQMLEWLGDTAKILFALWNDFPTARSLAEKNKKQLLVLVLHDSVHIPVLQIELRRAEIKNALNEKYIPTLLVNANPAHGPHIQQYSLLPSTDFVAAFYVFDPASMDVKQVLPVRQSDISQLRFFIYRITGERAAFN
ncbi:MAG: thioredoxin family protein [Ignavibacteriales bacterium]|nr:thioredoxin family protein [Ignavibacteriales bacterium]